MNRVSEQMNLNADELCSEKLGVSDHGNDTKILDQVYYMVPRLYYV